MLLRHSPSTNAHTSSYAKAAESDSVGTFRDAIRFPLTTLPANTPWATLPSGEFQPVVGHRRPMLVIRRSTQWQTAWTSLVLAKRDCRIDPHGLPCRQYAGRDGCQQQDY